MTLASLPSEGLLCVLTSVTPDAYYIRDSAGFDHQLSLNQAAKCYADSHNKLDAGSHNWAGDA